MTHKKLTQLVFAKRLKAAQAVLKISNAELCKRTGIYWSTFSRYRDAKYKSGPPDQGRIGLLERALGLPSGYFDGSVKVDLQRVKREQDVAGWTTDAEPGKAPTLAEVRKQYRDAMLALSTGADARGMIRLTLAVETLSKLYAEMLGAKEDK